MKKIIIVCYFLLIASVFGFSQSQQVVTTGKSCGWQCIEQVCQHFNIDKNKIPSYNPLSLAMMIEMAKDAGLNANVIGFTLEQLKDGYLPAILLLNNEHYIVLWEICGDSARIFDPLIGSDKVSVKNLVTKYSNNALVFSEIKPICGEQLAKNDYNKLKGYWDVPGDSYNPPPLDPSKMGNNPDEMIINCSNNGGGAPNLSFSPVTMNVLAKDTPLWYKGGIGPDISIDITYNSEDDQTEITSGTIQYYPMGKGWSLNYGTFYVQQGNDVLIVMPDGRRDLYTYVSGGGLTEYVFNPPSGVYNKLWFNGLTFGSGYVLYIKETKERYYFESSLHSKLTKIVDRNEKTISFFYDANLNLDHITDANNRVIQVSTNNEGRITSVTDPLNRSALFQYDNQGYLISITDIGNFTSNLNYANEAVGNTANGMVYKTLLTKIISPTSENSITYFVSTSVGFNFISKQITFLTNQFSKSFSWIPLSINQGILRYTDANQKDYDYYLNMDSVRIEKIVTPISNATIFYGYDAYSNRNQITVGNFTNTLLFNADGNVTKITDQRNKITNLTYYASTYFNRGDLQSITDPMGRVTNLTYDENSNLKTITTPTGTTTLNYYNSNYLLESIKNPNNFTSTFTYDSYGYLTTIQPPLGSPIALINDVVGRPTSKTENSVTITAQYDGLDQLVQTSFPDGTSIENTYDFQNLVSTTDRGGRITTYEYECGSNCQIKSSSGPQGTIVYERDGNGNILSIMINGQITNYFYDELNRQTKQINPDSTSKQFIYDAIDNLVTRLDENGETTTYSYNYNLLTQIDYSDNTPDIGYTYNDNGEVTSMTDGTGTTTFTYDNGGRLTGKDGPENDDNFTYTYDNNGNRTSMTLPGLNLSYSYNNLDQLTNVSNITHAVFAQYAYNANSLLTSKTYSNGMIASYSYNNLNKLTTLQNKKSNGQVFSGFNYTYDNASMISKISDHEGNISNYEYDYAYQLTNEQVITPQGKTLWHKQFAYDNMGNRLTLNKNGITDTYSYNINNQLLSLTKTTINVSGIVQGDSLLKVYVEDIDATTKYLGNNKIAFDATNVPLPFKSDSIQIAAYVNDNISIIGDSAKFISQAGQIPDHSVNVSFTTDLTGINPASINTIHRIKENILYSYDNNGNLTQRTFNGQSTTYTWDAENRLAEIAFPDGSNEKYIYDGFGQRVKILKNDTLQRRYIYDNLFEAVAIKFPNGNQQFITRGLNLGGGIGGIISLHENSTGNTFFHYNHRGDVISLSDANDSIKYSSDYDAFGEMLNQRGNSLSDFLFSSKEFNAKSCLSNFGFRYYSYEMIRWITKDPLGLKGGMNLNGFVNNNAINAVDIFGLFEASVTVRVSCHRVYKKLSIDDLVANVEKNEGEDENEEFKDLLLPIVITHNKPYFPFPEPLWNPDIPLWNPSIPLWNY